MSIGHSERLAPLFARDPPSEKGDHFSLKGHTQINPTQHAELRRKPTGSCLRLAVESANEKNEEQSSSRAPVGVFVALTNNTRTEEYLYADGF